MGIKINNRINLSYITTADCPWESLFRQVATETNKLETGYREGDKIQKGEQKMRKAKRGW